MEYAFRKAQMDDAPAIWELLQQAIERRKNDGSNQWQDGYPNPEVVKKDQENGYGYVLLSGNNIIAYCAVLINDEPAYAAIEGKWLTNADFVVVHRIAVSNDAIGRGITYILLESIEEMALEKGIHSIKVDTNFDNQAMLRILDKSGYTYCGEVYFRGSPRKAFEKVLS